VSRAQVRILSAGFLVLCAACAGQTAYRGSAFSESDGGGSVDGAPIDNDSSCGCGPVDGGLIEDTGEQSDDVAADRPGVGSDGDTGVSDDAMSDAAPE
jgi:hypothetical protein